MLWTTSGAIGVIERCESRMLDAPRHSIILGRLRNVLLGAGVALMVTVASAGAPVIGDAADALNLRGSLGGGLLLVVNTLGSVIVFAGIYRLAPRGHLRWRSAIVGAIPAGIAIQAIPALVGLYVGNFVGFAAVRLFLILAIVLLGLYVMATVILVGSGLAVKRELRHLRRVAPRRAGPRAKRFGAGREAAAEPESAPAAPGPGRPPAPTGA
jgi:membrane protein